MVNEGSVPLRNLIIETHTIKTDTDAILEHIKKIEEQLQNQADCLDITERLKTLEELVKERLKRDTSTNAAVNVLPQATESHDTGAAEDKAAA
jgi:hypothetical protein